MSGAVRQPDPSAPAVPEPADVAIRIERNVESTMRDGIVLRGDVWRPDDAGRYPALVQRTPYGKEQGSTDWLRLEHAVPNGYVAFVQDVRGRYTSEGDWRGLWPATWEQEARDTYDTVEWVAAQPWCDGNVGLYGGSYLGAVCYLGAATHPPHLRAIAPSMTGSQDRAALDTGGAFWLQLWIEYHLSMFVDQLPRWLASRSISPADADAVRTLALDPGPVIEAMPLRDGPWADVPGLPIGLADLVGDAGIGMPRTFELPELDVPVMVIGGWHDFYAARSVDQFETLVTSGAGSVRDEHRLLIGPWAHSVPTRVQGDVEYGPTAAALASAHPAQLAFFDRHLKGREVELPRVRYFVMGANEWRDAAAWPPVATANEAWYLRAGGRLAQAAPDEAEPVDHYRYDPADPVPTVGGRVGGVGGPKDQSRLLGRTDVLRYVSDPLAEAIEIVGHVTLVLHAATTAPDTDFVGRVVDVHADGAMMLIASGIARARFQGGSGRTASVHAGEVVEYRIGLGPTAIHIDAGHHLAVLVCSSDFPWYDRNMNTGGGIGLDAVGVVAEQTVFHDRTRPSRLELPVAAGHRGR